MKWAKTALGWPEDGAGAWDVGMGRAMVEVTAAARDSKYLRSILCVCVE
jgi:hypothetical protein